MEIEKTIEVLNTLIEINNDRIEGYEKASNETEEQDLKMEFAELARTSHKCVNELSAEIYKLGGLPTEGTKVSGKFFRTWMDVKTALTGRDRKAILSLCEYGEDSAQETYDDVINNDFEHLTIEQQALVYKQVALLRTDHNLVKSMRDVLV